MRVDTLPSPGLLSNGIRLRIEAAKAISAVEINAGIPVNAGKSSTAKGLDDFLTACRSAIATFIETVAPVIAARSATPANTSLIVLTYGEGLDASHVPPPSAFAVTGQVRTVTNVAIDGPFVFLRLNTPLVAGAVSVAYTQPGSVDLRLQDISGNQAVSFTATAVTNTIV
jgi:hypothetical protein